MNCRNIKVVLDEFKDEIERIKYDVYFGFDDEIEVVVDCVELKKLIKKLEKDLDCD